MAGAIIRGKIYNDAARADILMRGHIRRLFRIFDPPPLYSDGDPELPDNKMVVVLLLRLNRVVRVFTNDILV